MDYALSALQYVGIATTGLLAVLSLFFKFVDDENPARRRLTVPGRWALATIIFSVGVSLVSTTIKEISEGRQQRAAQTENARLASELRLTTETFNTLALHLTFSQPLDWREADFLGPDRRQQIKGYWDDGDHAVLADWLLTKDRTAPTTYSGYKTWDMQFVETRKPEIEEFIRQNPEFAPLNLTDIELVASPESTAPHTPELAMYFGYDTFNDSSSRVDFDAASPRLRARYNDEQGLTITLHTNIQYADLIGTKLALSYYFYASWTATTTDGLAMFEVKPSDLPLPLQRLLTVDVLLNGQQVARAYDAGKDKIKPSFHSQWDQQNDMFTADLVKDFTVTRAMLIQNYRPRG